MRRVKAKASVVSRSPRVWLTTTLAGLVVAACLPGLAWAGGSSGPSGQDPPSLPTKGVGSDVDCRATEPAPRAPSRQTAADVPDDRVAGERAAWNRLARAQFLAGDVLGALDSWNRLGEPQVDCVNVDGLVRTRRSVVIDYLHARRGDLLTSSGFTRMERRLDELPIASRSRVRYDRADDGSATLTTIVAERRVIPEGPKGWAVVAARAAFLQEVRLDVSGPTGRGDVWTPAYRWSGNRPRLKLDVEAPSPGRLPGIFHVRTFLERQTYRHDSLGDGIVGERRQRAGFAFSDWATGWLRWEGGAAFDRIADVSYVAVEGSANARALGDRLAVILTAGRWAPAGHGAPFASGELVATMRSTPRPDEPVFTTLVGVASAGDAAPLAIWPAASSGEGRGALLRAHPLRRDSVITGEVFGRQLVFTTSEYEHPVSSRLGVVGLAGFVDVARASRRLDPRAAPELQVDVGGGVRFNASSAGKLRLDVGYGVRDGRVRASAGYVVPWGRR